MQLEILRSLTNPVNLSRNRLWIIDDKWLNISGLYNLPGINPLNLKRFQIASTLWRLLSLLLPLNFRVRSDCSHCNAVISAKFKWTSFHTTFLVKLMVLFVQILWNILCHFLSSWLRLSPLTIVGVPKSASKLHHFHSEWIILQLLSVCSECHSTVVLWGYEAYTMRSTLWDLHYKAYITRLSLSTKATLSDGQILTTKCVQLNHIVGYK